MASTKKNPLLSRPSLIKGRYTGTLREDAEALVEKIRSQGGLAWYAEEWGSDHGHHSFWGYRVTWMTLASLRNHVKKADAKIEAAKNKRAALTPSEEADLLRATLTRIASAENKDGAWAKASAKEALDKIKERA
jgi:hypothetical protein